MSNTAVRHASLVITISNAVPFLHRLLLSLACEDKVRMLYAGDRFQGIHNWRSMLTDLIERVMAIAGSLTGPNPNTSYALHYHSPADPTTNLRLEEAANRVIVAALRALVGEEGECALNHPVLKWVIISSLVAIARDMESVLGYRVSVPTHVTYFLRVEYYLDHGNRRHTS